MLPTYTPRHVQNAPREAEGGEKRAPEEADSGEERTPEEAQGGEKPTPEVLGHLQTELLQFSAH